MSEPHLQRKEIEGLQCGLSFYHNGNDFVLFEMFQFQLAFPSTAVTKRVLRLA